MAAAVKVEFHAHYMRALLQCLVPRLSVSTMLWTPALLLRGTARQVSTRPSWGLQPAIAPQAARCRRLALPGALRRMCSVARRTGTVARGAAAATASVVPAPDVQELSWPQRDCGCGTLRPADVGRRVTLCGWVDRHRSLGGVVFVDVRDHTGAVQVVATPDSPAQQLLERVRSEYVVMVVGTVREKAAANLRLDSGAVEVVAVDVQVLNTVSRSLPFQVNGGDLPSEEVRLRRVLGGACNRLCFS